MAVFTVKQLRQRVAGAVDAVTGFAEVPFTAFNFKSVSQHKANKGFAVHVSDTAIHSNGVRQARSEGAYVITNFEVLFYQRLLVTNKVSSYDDSLDTENTIRLAVMGASQADVHIKYLSSNRQTDGSFVLISLTFEAIHRLTLE